ncbi:MAG: helix-turn-helix domain-containing protein [Lapillicoccus sp.]
MIPLDALVASLGDGLVRPLVAGPAGVGVSDIVIAEPGDADRDLTGDLVLGPAVVEGAGARDLLRRASASGAAGVVLRRGPARARGVRSTARQVGMALLELDDAASLVPVIALLGEIVGTASATGPARPDVGVEGDLLALADAAAGLVDAPVTIEDAQSRVLAYSSRQDVTDTARVSTIVGRRVPAALVAHYRSRGVFRRLARSDEPFLVSPGPGQEHPRFVVPVRAGGEWLGSIWAVVEGPPPVAVVIELRRAATVVALHLLRLRAQADLTRRVTAQRLRDLLGGASDAVETLAPPPWRVAVLGDGSELDTELDTELDRWAALLRRAGWRQPLVTTFDGRVYAIVSDGAVAPSRQALPGTWPWLARVVVESVVDDEDDAGSPTWVCAGPPAVDAAGLGRSRGVADELVGLRRTPDPSTVLTAEDCWATLTTARAVTAVGDPDRFPGPVPVLRAHDEERHTAYVPSLAAWLDHPGEPTAAARALGVHVNTLRYRMVRMSEVTDLPLDDPTARLALRLQLRALGH